MSTDTTCEPVYIYGYGKTKHIRDDRRTYTDGWNVDREFGLCGAECAYPFSAPERSVCKTL